MSGKAWFVISWIVLGFLVGCLLGRHNSPDWSSDGRATRFIADESGIFPSAMEPRSIRCEPWQITYYPLGDSIHSELGESSKGNFVSDIEDATKVALGTPSAKVLLSERQTISAFSKAELVAIAAATLGSGGLGFYWTFERKPKCNSSQVHRAFLSAANWHAAASFNARFPFFLDPHGRFVRSVAPARMPFIAQSSAPRIFYRTPAQLSPVAVREVALGRGCEDGRVYNRTDIFSPDDSVSVSVHTGGSSFSTRVFVRWLYPNGKVTTYGGLLSSTGESYHCYWSHDPHGVSVGQYTLELFLNDRLAATLHYRVR